MKMISCFGKRIYKPFGVAVVASFTMTACIGENDLSKLPVLSVPAENADSVISSDDSSIGVNQGEDLNEVEEIESENSNSEDNQPILDSGVASSGNADTTDIEDVDQDTDVDNSEHNDTVGDDIELEEPMPADIRFDRGYLISIPELQSMTF